MKIPDAKAVDKGWKKLETIQAWQLEKVNSKEEVIVEAQRDKKKVHFATLMDMCHLKNTELEPQFQKYKGRVVLRGDIVLCSFCWAGLVCVTNDCLKNNGCCWKSTRLWRTSSWCSICLHSGKNWRTLTDCSKFPSDNVQTYGHVFHDINGRNPRQSLKIPWYFFNKICMVVHQPDCYVMGKTILGSSTGTWMEKVPISECLFVHRKQGLLLSVFVDDIKTVGRKQRMPPLWKN